MISLTLLFKCFSLQYLNMNLILNLTLYLWSLAAFRSCMICKDLEIISPRSNFKVNFTSLLSSPVAKQLTVYSLLLGQDLG